MSQVSDVDEMQLRKNFDALAWTLDVNPAKLTDSDLFFRLEQKILASKQVSIPAVGIPVKPAKEAVIGS